MVILEARPLINLMLGMVSMEEFLTSNPGRFPPEVVEQLRSMSTLLVEECERLHLNVAADAAKGFDKAQSAYQLKQILSFVRDAMAIGLNRRRFLEPEPRYAEYFENPKLFGDSVFSAFPSATDDITEAGTCLALERSTACVMHLMRAAEVALRALAKDVGVTKQLDNWGSYLREIEKELNSRMKAAGEHTPKEEFYATAVAQLDHVKRAWRNTTMHVDKSYSQPRAEEILFATKSLMVHLAAGISE